MKVVLVIEEPNECIDCPCYRQTKEDGKLYEDCKAMMMPLNWREVTEKPSWCPLRPLNKIVKAGDRNLIIYERQWLYNHLEEEFELQKKARDFDAKSHISD